VIGISVYAPGAQVAPSITSLCEKTCLRLGTAFVPEARLDLRDRWLGPGYGLPTDPLREAISLAARSEGLLLDPVYTGKALAGLISLRRQGNLPGENVLFWHTGGSPGLFAYPELVPSGDGAHSSPDGAKR
jgi:1-aminocyclopropane-1-carboxylate deaminase/D-cysteine desulfhydrase-like pyridoxal-dependent ACC family enzyme